MDKPALERRTIRAEDIDPRYRWDRALPALGTMGVDFEERVDYRRLHRYRLARARQELEASDLGALLAFDLLQAPVPSDVVASARSDRAVGALAARLRLELLAGSWTRFDDAARARFHLALADGQRERARHLLHLARRYARPNALDREMVVLPKAMEPAYYGVRAVRLSLRWWSYRT